MPWYALVFMCNSEGLCKPVTDKLGPYETEAQCLDRVPEMIDELKAKLDALGLPDGIKITFHGGCGDEKQYLEALNG